MKMAGEGGYFGPTIRCLKKNKTERNAVGRVHAACLHGYLTHMRANTDKLHLKDARHGEQDVSGANC